MSHRGSTLPGDDPRIITAQGTVSSETASSASRISNTNRTIPLKYLDLSNLPDEGTPYASTEIFSDVAQTNVTPGITTWIKHQESQHVCLQEAQLVTDSILDVALERQLNPKWRGTDTHLTRNLIAPV